jgi:hypothetical protein
MSAKLVTMDPVMFDKFHNTAVYVAWVLESGRFSLQNITEPSSPTRIFISAIEDFLLHEVGIADEELDDAMEAYCDLVMKGGSMS